MQPQLAKMSPAAKSKIRSSIRVIVVDLLGDYDQLIRQAAAQSGRAQRVSTSPDWTQSSEIEYSGMLYTIKPGQWPQNRSDASDVAEGASRLDVLARSAEAVSGAGLWSEYGNDWQVLAGTGTSKDFVDTVRVEV